MATKLAGLTLPIPTPFTRDYALDEEALRDIIRFYAVNGGDCLAPCGSTGEFAFLSYDERKRVVDTTLEETKSRIPVVAGTHALTTDDAILLTKHAKDAGADAVLVVPTYYLKPTEKELYNYYADIAHVDIPIVVYNNPWTSKVDIMPKLIVKLAEEFSNIQYVKESSGMIQRVHEILRLTDKVTVFCGSDDLALESFAMGAKGWVAAGADICPKQAQNLCRAALVENNMEKSLKLYKCLLPLFNLLESSGRYTQYVKAGLELLGHPVGPPRKPLLPIDLEEKNALRQIMVQAGIIG